MSLQIGRIFYEKPIYYNKNVRIGPWVEENRKYVKNCLKHDSTYTIDYESKPFSARDLSHLWDNKFDAEGVHPRIIRDHEGQTYLENYSSLYDLSYNHFPKCIKGPITKHWRFRMQTYEPETDYTLNYGNITNFGLLDHKKEKWRCDKMKTTATTHYEDTFVAPKLEDFQRKRFAIPMDNSSTMLKQNFDILALSLRNETLGLVPEREKLVVIRSEPRCNPITWECPEALKKIPTRCSEQQQEPCVLSREIPKIPFECIMEKNK